MSRYWAELVNGIVQRVVVCDDEQWLADNLGGVWVETVDPYGPETVERYPGPGMGSDPAWDICYANPWQQPTGAHDAYDEGVHVHHDGRIWLNLTAANVWEPGVSGWRDTPVDGSPAPWTQPTGAHDAYAKGDVVIHENQVWESTLDANVWEPGVAGWVTV